MYAALITPEGFADGVIQCAESGLSAFVLPRDRRAIPLADADLAAQLQQAGSACRWVGDHWCRVEDEERLGRWDRHRGLSPQARQYESSRRREAQEACRHLPADHACPAPPAFAVVRAYHFEPVEIMPHLRLRLMEDGDLAAWAETARRSGLFPPEAEQPRLEAWWEDAACWPLVLTWHDEPLQYDCYHFLGSGRVRAGFNVHLDRERPHWFWREVSRPVFLALEQAGVTAVESFIRGDRPDWADRLTATFGGEARGRTVDGFIRLRYEIGRCLAACAGWPARRRVRAGWTWELADVTLREATEEDLPGLLAWVDEEWAGHGRLPAIRRMVERRWALDQAAIVLASVAGRLQGAWVIRERGPTEASVAYAGRYRDDEAAGIIQCGMAVWQRAAGYERSALFVRERVWDHPSVRRHLRRSGHTEVRRVTMDEPLVELSQDLDDVLRRPEAAWRHA